MGRSLLLGRIHHPGGMEVRIAKQDIRAARRSESPWHSGPACASASPLRSYATYLRTEKAVRFNLFYSASCVRTAQSHSVVIRPQSARWDTEKDYWMPV